MVDLIWKTLGGHKENQDDYKSKWINIYENNIFTIKNSQKLVESIKRL